MTGLGLDSKFKIQNSNNKVENLKSEIQDSKSNSRYVHSKSEGQEPKARLDDQTSKILSPKS